MKKVIRALYKYSVPSTSGENVSLGQLLENADGLVLTSFPLAFTEK